jgi:hypothetical protein
MIGVLNNIQDKSELDDEEVPVDIESDDENN